MISKIRTLIGRSVSCVALTGFVLATGATVVPSTPANAVVGIRDLDVCDWRDYDWDEMSSVERSAWAVLGWTEDRWGHEAEPVFSYSKDWEDLSAGERGALTDLGYDEDDWDDDDC